MKHRVRTISELIAALQAVAANYGDLPVGGEGGPPDDTGYVSLIVCDEEGCEAGPRPAHQLFIETV